MTEQKQKISNQKLQLYPHQEADVAALFERLAADTAGNRLLYQLPTGGGKTVVFAEISKRFLEQFQKKVLVLTHRLELCKQTATMLKKLGVKNKVIDSSVKRLASNDANQCYVAMVQTLKNRIKDKLIKTEEIGLVIIDEAHHNSFHKLLNRFPNAKIIGVTATPLSCDSNRPLNKSYGELIAGCGISDLITRGYLSKPEVHSYDVEINTLQTGLNGDFTMTSSDELYGAPAMLNLLLQAYEAHAKGKKTLIFNNGVITSKKVQRVFTNAGYEIKHLDHKASNAERNEILDWFKKKKNAILTSVSILTTGFDEPTIKAIMLNRATTSLSLYHQMIGRGARTTRNKAKFTVIDLGNNIDRFGEWNAELDWQDIFQNPEAYRSAISNHSELHAMPSELRSLFPHSLELAFDVVAAYDTAIQQQRKSKTVISDSIRQHALMCIENAETVVEALSLADDLEKEIDWRVKQYSKCLGNVTRSYTTWLQEEYKTKLKKMIQKLMHRNLQLQMVG